ncbi:MAG: hypothetical protein WBI14_06210 [Anaerolineaceae bacterium]
MQFTDVRKPDRIVLTFMLAIFLFFSVYIAFNIKRGIIPDESLHGAYITKFSKTWGIPVDGQDTFTSGVYIKGSPFLFYWLGGRLESLFGLVVRGESPTDVWIFHRVVNSLLSTTTILFTYLIGTRIIKNVWLQLLPPFMLANTLMYALLAGGINYDNLTNLLITAAIYYYIRMVQAEYPLKSLLAWIALISLASLTKETALPVAGMMVVLTIVIFIRRGMNLDEILYNWKATLPLLIFTSFTLLLAGSFYANNIIRYQSVEPNCQDMYTEQICEMSAFVKRDKTLQLPEKLTIRGAINAGWYEPVQYVFYSWIGHMADKTYGFHGHNNYFPYVAGFFPILFLWIILVSVRGIKDWGTVHTALAVFVVSVTLTILVWNYNSELKFGFKHVAVQGRYLFPIIGTYYALLIYGLERVKSKFIMIPTLIILLVLFMYSGPLRLLLSPENFTGWFN